MDKDPLDEAKTRWLREFLAENLASVEHLTVETDNWATIASEFAERLNEVLNARGLQDPYQQKNSRSQVANALRCLNAEHPAIPYPYTLLSPDTYTLLNLEQTQKTEQRQSKFISSSDAIALVEKAASLLESHDPNDVAAGLAVLIGRRISEILISGFEPCTPYSVWFSNPVKKDGQIPPFEIPTLIEAERVLAAIANLRQVWKIDDIKATSTSERQLKQAINKRYEGVPKAVRRHFSDLIPGRETDNDSGEKLYTHVFRSVYAEIATYFYKPSRIPDHRFKAEIQGHFTLTDQGKVRSYTSRPHYDDYLIGDRTPNQEGLQLSLPNVSVLAVFSGKDSREDTETQEDKEDLKRAASLASIETDTKERSPLPPQSPKIMNNQDVMAMLKEQYELAVKTNEQMYHAKLEGKDAVIEQQERIIKEKDERILSLEKQLNREAAFRGSNPQLSQENEHLLAEVQRLQQLNESLEAQRQQVQTQLDHILSLLSEEPSSVVPSSQDNLPSAEINQAPTTGKDKTQNTGKDKGENIGKDKSKVSSNNGHQPEFPPQSNQAQDKVAIIDRAIDAIKNYNEQPQRSSHEKWYISNPVVCQLIRDSGHPTSTSSVQVRLKERSSELEQHYQLHQISRRQNTKHDLPISQFLTLD